ncbi:unnamed protein product [Closterium sp. NIES-54]
MQALGFRRSLFAGRGLAAARAHAALRHSPKASHGAPSPVRLSISAAAAAGSQGEQSRQAGIRSPQAERGAQVKPGEIAPLSRASLPSSPLSLDSTTSTGSNTSGSSSTGRDTWDEGSEAGMDGPSPLSPAAQAEAAEIDALIAASVKPQLQQQEQEEERQRQQREREAVRETRRVGREEGPHSRQHCRLPSWSVHPPPLPTLSCTPTPWVSTPPRSRLQSFSCSLPLFLHSLTLIPFLCYMSHPFHMQLCLHMRGVFDVRMPAHAWCVSCMVPFACTATGRSNVVEGLARAIRLHFTRHALVKVGIRGRAAGTPAQEIVKQLEVRGGAKGMPGCAVVSPWVCAAAHLGLIGLSVTLTGVLCAVWRVQEATGGVFVSQEPSKVVLYRGWEDGQPAPWEGPRVMQVTPQLVAAMQSEAGTDLGMHAVEGRAGMEGTGSEGEVEEEEGESWTDQFDQYGTEVIKEDVELLHGQQRSEIRDS